MQTEAPPLLLHTLVHDHLLAIAQFYHLVAKALARLERCLEDGGHRHEKLAKIQIQRQSPMPLKVQLWDEERLEVEQYLSVLE